MSWISNISKWWLKNILHHGEDDNISDSLGKSESDMSKPLSDEDWRRYSELTGSSPFVGYVNKRDALRSGFQSKDWRDFYKKSARNIGTGVALALGIPALTSRKTGTDNSADALAIQALQNSGAILTDGSNSRQSNGFWNLLKSAFSGDGSFSMNLAGLGSALAGIGSQFGSSVLNYQNQVKLIDKQNEYNTPANQMQRFMDAGLNPNLIYGLGSNGNQPASGSVAPVDFDTSQRENRLARMQIQTQTALAKADIASKMADVQLKEKQGNNVDASTNAQLLANNTYMQTWFMDMNVKSQQLRESANRITNDNRRIEFENAVADAQKALFEYQSQPDYMQKIGSAESFISAFDAFMNKLGEKIMSNSPWQKSDFYWDDGLLKVTGLREVDERIGRWRSN